MRPLRYVVCDVFTDRPLTGNPLAVFTNGTGIDDAGMQALAREMNLSESVFVLPGSNGAQAKLRIFTPHTELPFAGHPVLGSAFVIGTTVQLDELTLETGAGAIRVRLEREGARVSFGWMDQPVPKVSAYAESAELLNALGVSESALPVELYDNGTRHVYVALPSFEAVAKLRPNMARLADLPPLCVSAFFQEGARIKTRMFAPGLGVNEDPATGSAAGPLAVHLVRHGRVKYGEELRIEQGEEIQRPSVLYARAEGAGQETKRIEVGGAAIVVARGEFRLPLM